MEVAARVTHMPRAPRHRTIGDELSETIETMDVVEDGRLTVDDLRRWIETIQTIDGIEDGRLTIGTVTMKDEPLRSL